MGFVAQVYIIRAFVDKEKDPRTCPFGEAIDTNIRRGKRRARESLKDILHLKKGKRVYYTVEPMY